MNITLITQGTYGDVRPYVALGKALQERGHIVKIASATSFENFVRAHNLDFSPLAGDPKENLESFGEVTEGGNPLNNIRFIQAVLPKMGRDMLTAAENSQLILSNFNTSHLAYSVAEKLGIPFVEAALLPMLATSSYPNPHILLEKPHFWPQFLNRLTYAPVDQLLWQPFRKAINQFRAELGLDAYPFWGYASHFERCNLPRLEAYSAHIWPLASDWGKRVQITGFWFLEDDWQAPPRLIEFLNQDPKPIYIGFGSMNFGDATKRTKIILDALTQTGQRAILAGGWGGLQDIPQNEAIYQAESIPHSWIFPRVAAAIHHGGAGTTAAALHAGIPQGIVPFFGDQPFWGSRIAALGLGTKPLPRKQLNQNKLIVMLRELEKYQTFVKEFGAKIRAENGTLNAIRILEGKFALLR